MIWLWLAACSGEQEKQLQELATASENVIFASVESLGKHDYLALIVRDEYQGGEKSSHHEESIAIQWQDWDHFSYRRLVDGKGVMNLIVSKHVPWLLRPNGKWKKRRDAEPYRVQMRNSWNAWEQIVSPFSDGLEMKGQGFEQIEGRRVQRFQLEYTPPESQPNGVQPARLSGSVWVDQETAVRILAEVECSLENGP